MRAAAQVEAQVHQPRGQEFRPERAIGGQCLLGLRACGSSTGAAGCAAGAASGAPYAYDTWQYPWLQ